MKSLKTIVSTLALTLPMVVATSANAKPKKEINLQSVAVEQCVAEMLHFKMSTKATAKKYCKCTTNVQAKNLKLGEFWQLQSYGMNRKNPRNLPAFKRIAPKLEACKKGLKINPPTKPAPKKK